MIADCLNIKYNYESASSIEPLPDLNQSTAELSSPIPLELVSQMQSASMSADLDLILELVSQLDQAWPQTAARIRALASSLHYNELLAYLKDK